MENSPSPLLQPRGEPAECYCPHTGHDGRPAGCCALPAEALGNHPGTQAASAVHPVTKPSHQSLHWYWNMHIAEEAESESQAVSYRRMAMCMKSLVNLTTPMQLSSMTPSSCKGLYSKVAQLTWTLLAVARPVCWSITTCCSCVSLSCSLLFS